MINPFTQINWKPELKDLKSFGKSMIIGFTVIALLILIVSYWRHSPAPRFAGVLFGIGVIIWLLSLTIPRILVPIYYVWFFASACIGIVISNLVLVIFFYVIFTPFALGLKLFTGRDPLALKKPAGKKSYWVDSSKRRSLESYLRQF